MATRTLNSTGRSRITLEMIELAVLQDNSKPRTRVISVRCDMRSLDLPENSSLHLDLSNDFSEVRFDVTNDNQVNRIEVDSGFFSGTVRARLSSSSFDSKGVALINAESVQILIDGPSGETTLNSPLVLRPDPDLEVPWKLDHSKGDFMVLVSNRGNLWTEYLKASKSFKALIAGPLILQICLHLLSDDGDTDGASMTQWIKILKPYGLDLSVLDDDLDLSEKLEIASRISEEFARKQNVLDGLIKKLGDSDDQD